MRERFWEIPKMSIELRPCRSLEAVLMDPATYDEDGGGGGDGGMRAGQEQQRRTQQQRPRTPLQTMRVKGRLGADPGRERRAREREQLSLLEDIEANRANTDPR